MRRSDGLRADLRVVQHRHVEAAGLTDKDIPTTWDRLLEVAKKLTKSDGSQYGLADGRSGWAAT